MTDWSKPLTLCWCGFEFHGTQYSRPYLGDLAEMVNEYHLRTHEIEVRTTLINERRERIEEFIRSIPPIEFDPNIITGHDGR